VLGANVAALNDAAPSDRAGVAGRLGPYWVLERIGTGGMDVVLKALDERLGRIVAIKITDFGLARAIDYASITESGVVLTGAKDTHRMI
jgi:hypothetical protein